MDFFVLEQGSGKYPVILKLVLKGYQYFIIAFKGKLSGKRNMLNGHLENNNLLNICVVFNHTVYSTPIKVEYYFSDALFINDF